MPDYTLAVHPATDGLGSHDPSALLFVDGELAFGVEEERLVRRKHAPGTFPTRSIRACLRHADGDPSAVDRVAVPWGDESRAGSAGPNERDSDSPNERDSDSPNERDSVDPAEGDSDAASDLARRLSAAGLTPVPPVERYDHHRSHAASAFFPSGFDESLVLTVDGRGNRDATAVWLGDDRGLERLASSPAPNSLGYFYAAVTAYLGFEPFGGEGKLMALAAYGDDDPTLATRLRSLVEPGVDYDVTGLVGQGIPSAVSRLTELFGRRPARPPDPSNRWAANLAAATQRFLEETVVAIVEQYCDRRGVRSVCLAGGVALNCKLNGRVAESPVVERTFVQPVAGDAGAPIGAGLLASDESRWCMRTVSLGPSYSSTDVARLLDRRGVDYSRPDDPVGVVAERLADGALVGWFRGRAELGPRALGNRSILADPRSRDAAARINAFVKRREAWRPLAPSLPAEAADRYLQSPRPSPFMIDAFDVPPERRAEIPAVIHPGDGTTRPQTVRAADHPAYHRLLTTFGDLTGVPVLLNTSFNRRGEPIVTTPSEALEAFAETALDFLVVEDTIVEA